MTNIEKLVENGGWLPIEEAPKDGRVLRLLVRFSENEQYQFDGMFSEYRDEWCSVDTNRLLPTHFMSHDTPDKLAKALGIALKALRYCAVEPYRMHPQNQASFRIAQDAIEDMEKVCSPKP